MSPFGLPDQIGEMMKRSDGVGGVASVHGLTLATVKDANEKQKLNRVRCLPIGLPDAELTDWCYVMTPMGGKESGLFLFPKVGDLVVLGYLGNDVHRPIVLGSFWNTESKAPAQVQKGKCDDYLLTTPGKIEVKIHDEEKKQKIFVTLPSGAMVVVDEEKQVILTKNKGEDTALILKMKDGEAELKAKSKLTLKAGKATLTLEQNGNITVKGNKIALDGSSIEAKAKGKLALQGTDVAAQANKGLELKSTGITTVKGSLLKLN
jgi:uncharacterized protein involved in type VI secretion and phage assembly